MASDISGVSRRDFLSLRTQASRRILEISCHLLHLNYVSLRFTGMTESHLEDDFTDGELPPVFARRTVDELMGVVAREMHAVDVVRVLDRSWLAPTDLRTAFEAVLESFRAGGGSVEYSP